MTNSLPLYATLGAHVSPALAQEPTVGSASQPGIEVQVVPLVDVAIWMLMVWLGDAKFCVA